MEVSLLLVGRRGPCVRACVRVGERDTRARVYLLVYMWVWRERERDNNRENKRERARERTREREREREARVYAAVNIMKAAARFASFRQHLLTFSKSRLILVMLESDSASRFRLSSDPPLAAVACLRCRCNCDRRTDVRTDG